LEGTSAIGGDTGNPWDILELVVFAGLSIIGGQEIFMSCNHSWMYRYMACWRRDNPVLDIGELKLKQAVKISRFEERTSWVVAD